MADYEAMLEQYYTGLLVPGDNCIDVGAHEGRHAFPMARLVGAGGSVQAFEPIPRMAEGMRAAMAGEAGLGNINLRQFALSEAPGTAEFVLVNEAPGYSGLRERQYDMDVTTQRIVVELRTLDSFLPELPRIRFLKVDCEGAETLVLRGARGLLARDRPVVGFECGDAALSNYDHDAGDLFDHGLLLVRPDQVVAWCGTDTADASAVWARVACAPVP